METFTLTDLQAQAIVEMTLGKLAGLERLKIETELAEKEKLIGELRDILAHEEKIIEIITNEMLEIKRKYADKDPRRTEICVAENEIVLEDLIERHTCVITMTHTGYIKRQPADTYTAQRRGGKGIIGMSTKEEDFVEDVHIVPSHSFLLMFTNLGRVYVRKAYQIPEAGRTAKGTSVVNVLELSEGEKVTTIIDLPSFEENEYLFMVTHNGVVKRTSVKDFEYQRRGGKIAIDLDEGDSLDYVRHTKGDDEIVFATHHGQALRIHETQARVMGRGARGVRGMTLSDDDYIVGVTVVKDDEMLISIAENGFGKLTSYDEYTAHHRGGKGIVCHSITEKTGLLSGIAGVKMDDDVMLITNEGVIIRTPVSDIRVCGRASQGVIVMRLGEDAKIVNFARVEQEKDSDEIAETTENGEDIELLEISTADDAPKTEE